MPFNINGTVVSNTLVKLYNERNIVRNGLILYLDTSIAASYPGSGTTWSDLSGNNYTETLVNGPAYNTSNGGYISFDGVDDYASGDFSGTFISNPELNGNIFSFGCWCYVIGAGSYYILSSGGQTSSAGIAFSYQNGSPFVDFKGTSRESFINISSANFPLNTWINWMFVSNNVHFKVYKNGTYLQQEGVNNGGSNDIYTLLSVAAPNNALTSYLLNGRVANVSFYNRVLSESEILQNFNASRGRFGI